MNRHSFSLPLARMPWRAVVVFFLLACLWSWPLFWLRDMMPTVWAALPVPHPLRMTAIMWGPGLAALLCWRMFRPQVPRQAAIWGRHWPRALAFYAVPMLALAAIGVDMPHPTGPQRAHALLLLIAVLGFVNCLGEELGWRGFLQDALQSLRQVPRYVLIGIMWAGWHFTNLFASRSDPVDLLRYLAWYLPTTVVLSFLLGRGVERSRAIAVAVTLHAWTNLSLEFAGPTTWTVLVLSIPFWVWLLWTWPQPSAGFVVRKDVRELGLNKRG